MRKRGSVAFLLTVLLIAQLLPGRAWAEGLVPMAHENFAVGAYTKENVAVVEGNWYVLTVASVEDLALVDEDSLLYIGAACATAEDEAARAITFRDVRLRRMVRAYYFVTGLDADGQPLPATAERSGTLELFGQVVSPYGGAFEITMIDEFGYYHADETVATEESGAFHIGEMAPGRYKLRIDRPGYLPRFYAPAGDEYLTLIEDITLFLGNIDVSAQLGDVNGDGVLSLLDLTALIGELAAGGDAESADLNNNGAVGGEDMDILTAPGGQLKSSLGTLEEPPTLRAEAATGPAEGVYALVLAIDGVDTAVTAAGFTMLYDSDVIALCTVDGSEVTPAEGGLAEVLTPASGLALLPADWTEGAGVGTLSLRLYGDGQGGIETKDAPLGTLYFKLREGMTEAALFADSIVIPTAWAAAGSALVRLGAGEDTLTASALYANSEVQRLEALTLTGPTSIQAPIYYPALNQPGMVNTQPSMAVLTLTGQSTLGKEIPPPADVEWRVAATPSEGIRVVNGAVLVSGSARAETVTVQAVAGGVESNAFTLELKRDVSVPTIVSIFRNHQGVTAQTLKLQEGESDTAIYTATVYDQYGAAMPDAAVSWSSPGGLPAGVTLNGGTVSVGENAVDSAFYLQAASGAARVTATIQIRRIKLAKLAITGQPSAVVPPYFKKPNSTEGNQTPGETTYSVTAFDGENNVIETPSSLVWSLVDGYTGVSIEGEEGSGSALLLVEPASVGGAVRVTATAKGITGSLPVTIARAVSMPYRLVIQRGGSPLGLSDTISQSTTYSARVYNQYNQTMDKPNIEWTTGGTLPAGISVSSSGAVTVGANPAAGSFTLRAASGQANQTVTVTISLPSAPPVGDGGTGDPGAQEPNVSYSGDRPVMAILTPVAKETAPNRFAVALTAEEMTAASAGKSGTFVVRPQVEATLSEIELTLPGAGVAALAAGAANRLALETVIGTLTLPRAALAAAAGKGIRIVLSREGALTRVQIFFGETAVDTIPGGIVLALSAKAAPIGQVAAVVAADGSERVVRTSAVADGVLLTPLSGSAVVRVEAKTPSFRDIAGHWAAGAVAFASARDLVKGVDGGSRFAPAMTMTRGMLVTVLHRLAGEPTAEKPTPLTDVAEGSWYKPAVDWAGELGIVNTSAGIAAPEQDISREQIATMLYRYAGVLGLNTKARKPLAAFPDAGEVSPYADDAMRWAVAVGILNGKSDGRLDPAGVASRAEVVTMLERFVVFCVREV